MTASALPLPRTDPLQDLVSAQLPQGFARIVQDGWKRMPAWFKQHGVA